MKHIKNTENFKLGLISLFFLSVFLYSNLLKSSLVAYSEPSSDFQIETVSKGKSVQSLSNSTENSLIVSEETSLDQFNLESDFEDFHLKQFSDFRNKLLLFFDTDSKFFQKSFFNSFSELPLYDLYCNWKFHLNCAV